MDPVAEIERRLEELRVPLEVRTLAGDVVWLRGAGEDWLGSTRDALDRVSTIAAGAAIEPRCARIGWRP